MTERSRADRAAPAPETAAPGGSAADAQAGAAIEAAVRRLTDVVEGLRQLTEVRLSRARLEFREKLFRGIGWGLLAVFLGTLIVASTLRTVSGASGWLAARFPGDPWIGDLIGGLAGFAVAAAVAVAVRARLRRRSLDRLRSRLQPAAQPSGEAP